MDDLLGVSCILVRSDGSDLVEFLDELILATDQQSHDTRRSLVVQDLSRLIGSISVVANLRVNVSLFTVLAGGIETLDDAWRVKLVQDELFLLKGVNQDAATVFNLGTIVFVLHFVLHNLLEDLTVSCSRVEVFLHGL